MSDRNSTDGSDTPDSTKKPEPASPFKIKAKAVEKDAPDPDEDVDQVQAIVAPRRTVQKDGRRHGPNAVVSFPAAEVERLRGLGYLLPTNGQVEIPIQGPTVNNERTDIVKPK